MISWEAVSAIAAVASTVIVAATVVVGYRQILNARDQVSQLRRATQLQGTMAIFAEFASVEHVEGVRWILEELPERVKDESYLAELKTHWSKGQHPELGVLRRYERVGTLVRYELIEPDALLDFMNPTFMRVWDTLRAAGVLGALREAQGPKSWLNAELLYDRSVARAANLT